MEQPKPVKNDQPIVHEMVIIDVEQTGLCGLYTKDVVFDLRKRLAKGIETYGTPLQPFNGRNALWDMYEELLDAVCYLRQDMYETGVNDEFMNNKRSIYRKMLVVLSEIRHELGDDYEA